MALMKIRNTRGDLNRLHRDFDDMIRSFFSDLAMPWESSSRINWPAIDIAENDSEILVKAEVPGCKAEDIDISVQGQSLRIKGEKKHEEERESKGSYHVERFYGSFDRQIPLPGSVDVEKIEASCKEGVLDIRVPKLEKEPARKIEVKGETDTEKIHKKDIKVEGPFDANI